MKTHNDTPENVSFEVRQSMKTSYEAMSEQIINVYTFNFIWIENQYKQRFSWISKTHTKTSLYGETPVRRTYFTAKFPYGETSVRRNFLRRNFPKAKFPYGEISLRQNFLMGYFPMAKLPTVKFPTAKFPVTFQSTFAELLKKCTTMHETPIRTSTLNPNAYWSDYKVSWVEIMSNFKLKNVWKTNEHYLMIHEAKINLQVLVWYQNNSWSKSGSRKSM